MPGDRPQLYVALDMPADDALRLAAQLGEAVDGVKIGSTLFTTTGPRIVDAFVEGLKTALCLAFVTQPMSSASSASSADGAIGLDFNAAMTILCALLETAVNIYHGR